MNTATLQKGILMAVGKLNRGGWVEQNITDWRLRITQAGPSPADLSGFEDVDAIVALASEGLMNIQKYPYRVSRPVPFDLARSNDDAHKREFFLTGPFQLRLTHGGRRVLDEIEKTSSPVAKERAKIGFA